MDGGLSPNRYFTQFLANLIQKRIVTPANKEITAQGVALLARKGLGVEQPLKVLNRYEVTEPTEVDMAVWFARYQEIIARSRAYVHRGRNTMAEFGEFHHLYHHGRHSDRCAGVDRQTGRRTGTWFVNGIHAIGPVFRPGGHHGGDPNHLLPDHVQHRPSSRRSAPTPRSRRWR